MNLKDIRNRINKRINAKYDERQKILSKVKNALSIEFNKISFYRDEIIINKKNFQNKEDANNIQASKGTKRINAEDGVDAGGSGGGGVGRRDNGAVDATSQFPLFKIELPESIIGSARFYYKGMEVDFLSIENLKSLENDLEFILKEIEREIDKFLV
jgi:hypothetical protein